MELEHYLRLVLRGWWIVILTTLAAVAIALTLSFITTPMYQAKASFIVSPNKAVVPNQNLVESLGTLDKRSIIATYSEVVNSNRIYNETTTALQMDPAEPAKYTHSTTVLPDANVLILSVTGPDPQKAAVLANGIGQRGINYVKGLYQAYDINLLDPAIPPTAPISPQPVRDVALAFGLGLVIGSLLAILAGQMHSPQYERRSYRREPIPTGVSGQYVQRR